MWLTGGIIASERYAFHDWGQNSLSPCHGSSHVELTVAACDRATRSFHKLPWHTVKQSRLMPLWHLLCDLCPSSKPFIQHFQGFADAGLWVAGGLPQQGQLHADQSKSWQPPLPLSQSANAPSQRHFLGHQVREVFSVFLPFCPFFCDLDISKTRKRNKEGWWCLFKSVQGWESFQNDLPPTICKIENLKKNYLYTVARLRCVEDM